MDPNELKELVAPVCRKHGVKRLDLFGSRARSRTLEGRDFDFVADFDSRLSPAEYATRFFRVLHELEDALDSPVDLLTRDSIRKQSLSARIGNESLCVYES